MRKQFIVVAFLILYVISLNAAPALSAPKPISLGTGIVAQENFPTQDSVNAWQAYTFNGSQGNIAKSWVSNIDGRTGLRVDVSNAGPLPGSGLQSPMANAIISNRWTPLLDGLYKIEAKIATQDQNLGAFQLIAYFLQGNDPYQATFHFRTGDWSDLPFPNKGGPGIYVYDKNDWPQRVGDLPYLGGKTWISVRGVFDTRTMSYVSIGIEDVDIKLANWGLVLAYGNPFIGNDNKSGINLSMAGKLGSTTLSAAWRGVGLYPILDGPTFGKVGDPLTWTAKPTPSEGGSLMKGGIYISEISGKVLASEWGCVHSSGKQAVPADGIWCFLSLPAEADGTYKATWYPPKAGNYLVATTAWDTGATQCSDNPYVKLPWTSAGGLVYADCGISPTIVTAKDVPALTTDYLQILSKK